MNNEEDSTEAWWEQEAHKEADAEERDSPRTATLIGLQLTIEDSLKEIERVLGPDYNLTLLAKYCGPKPLKDADIILTRDTRENMLTVINRFFPPPP